MTQLWTIKAALDWTVGYLDRKGDVNPRLSAQWLLSEATGLSRIELYTHFDKPLSPEEREVLRGSVSRRGAGEPLQYITGEVGFRHITIKVRSGVLIPRPETEVLVSEVLDRLARPQRPRSAEYLYQKAVEANDVVDGAANDARLCEAGDSARENAVEGALSFEGDLHTERTEWTSDVACAADVSCDASFESLLVADIGTGTGCIACSLAYEHPLVQVIAADVSDDALRLAAENVELLGLANRVQVVKSDIGLGIDQALLGSFDAVVSNPPYIPDQVMKEIPEEVSGFEPWLALAGGADGLDVVRRLIPWCFKALKPGGFFAFELYEGHLDEAASLAREGGFAQVEVKKDLTNTPRILVGVKSNREDFADSSDSLSASNSSRLASESDSSGSFNAFTTSNTMSALKGSEPVPVIEPFGTASGKAIE